MITSSFQGKYYLRSLAFHVFSDSVPPRCHALSLILYGYTNYIDTSDKDMVRVGGKEYNIETITLNNSMEPQTFYNIFMNMKGMPCGTLNHLDS